MKELKFKSSNTKQSVGSNSFEMYKQLDNVYWGGRGEKQGRNDKCRCGSGKKFKKCCGKETSFKGRESLLKQMTGGHLGKELNKSVPYVVGWKDLRNEEFNERFMEFLKVYPVLDSGCFFNSFKLMYEMRDLGVEQVHGWYGFDVGTTSEYEHFVKRYLDGGGLEGQEYVYDSSKVDDGDNEHWPGYDCLWDYDKGVVWKRHAWNKLNGVHFDTTRECMEKEWVYYNELKTQDWSDLLFSQKDDSKVPNVFKQLQYSVQSVSRYFDESLKMKNHKFRNVVKRKELKYNFN